MIIVATGITKQAGHLLILRGCLHLLAEKRALEEEVLERHHYRGDTEN
jgi:hypothetical protein